jgi:hypothetical protein
MRASESPEFAQRASEVNSCPSRPGLDMSGWPYLTRVGRLEAVAQQDFGRGANCVGSNCISSG